MGASKDYFPKRLLLLRRRYHNDAVSSHYYCAEFVLGVFVDDFVCVFEDDVHVLVVSFEEAAENFAVAKSHEDFGADAF